MLKARRDSESVDAAMKLDGLTDEAPRRALPRLMTWTGIAMLAVGAALLAARSETGARRLASLGAPPAPPPKAAEARQPASDPLLVYETRRLADHVRQLAAERETLSERVAAIERGFGDITASIPRGNDAARPAARAVAPPQAPAPAIEPPVAAGSAPTSAPLPVPAPTAGAAVGAAAEAQDSTALRTEFGVDLAGDQSIDALRSRWQQLRAQHGPVLEGLRPVVAIQEGSRAGGVELRLVAGPLSNANAAARLCATLSLAGVNCKPTVFDGQRLALR